MSTENKILLGDSYTALKEWRHALEYPRIIQQRMEHQVAVLLKHPNIKALYELAIQPAGGDCGTQLNPKQ